MFLATEFTTKAFDPVPSGIGGCYLASFLVILNDDFPTLVFFRPFIRPVFLNNHGGYLLSSHIGNCKEPNTISPARHADQSKRDWWRESFCGGQRTVLVARDFCGGLKIKE